MKKDLIEKLFHEAVNNNAAYVVLKFDSEGLSYSSDGGKRKSTRNHKITEDEKDRYEKKLRTLDQRCLLFSGSVLSLKIEFRDGRTAEYEKQVVGENIVRIISCKVSEKNVKDSLWVCYSANNCGVAFALSNSKKYGRLITPCEGAVFNEMNYVSDEQNLMFCMSGDNQGVVQLLEYSIPKLMRMREFQQPSFAVFPNSMDELDGFAGKVHEIVKELCDSRPVFRNYAGNVVSRSKLAFGTDDVRTMFPQDLLQYTFLRNRSWFPLCEPGSREEYFLLVDLKFIQYDRDHFLNSLLSASQLDDLAELIERQNDKWLRNFLLFCSDVTVEGNTRWYVVSALKNLKCIRDSKNRMQYPHDITILGEDAEVLKNAVVVKETIIRPGGKSDKYTEQLLKFFTEELKIKRYGMQPGIETLANDLATKKQAIDKNYCDKLMQLVSFDRSNPDRVEFGTYAIFPVENGKVLKRVTASEVVIGKPYVKEGILLARALERRMLWSGFQKLLSSDDLDQLISFAEKYGAIGKPRVVKQSAESHKAFKKELFAEGKQTGRDTCFDYMIPGLEDMLRKHSLQLNKLIWDCVLAITDEEAEKYLYAEYSCNNRETVNRVSSSLMTLLQQRTWVPDKDNKLHIPKDIVISEIHDDFRFDKKNPILRNLNFGANVVDKDKKMRLLQAEAKSLGLMLITQEEYEEYLSLKKRR